MINYVEMLFREIVNGNSTCNDRYLLHNNNSS